MMIHKYSLKMQYVKSIIKLDGRINIIDVKNSTCNKSL